MGIIQTQSNPLITFSSFAGEEFSMAPLLGLSFESSSSSSSLYWPSKRRGFSGCRPENKKNSNLRTYQNIRFFYI